MVNNTDLSIFQRVLKRLKNFFIAFMKNMGVFVLFGLTIILFYGKTVHHDFSLDDNYVLTNVPPDVNHFWDAFEAFVQPFDRVDYRPIPIFTFALQQIMRDEIHPGHSHGVNMFFYLLGVFALFRMLLHVFREHEYQWLIALGTALLFIAHPIHSNVVSSLKNRDILLSFLFAVLAFSSFLKMYHRRRLRHLPFMLLFMLLSLLSKLDGVWVLLLIPAYHFMHNPKINWRMVLRGAFILALMLGMIQFRFWLANSATDALVDPDPILFTENPMVRNGGPLSMIFYAMVSVFYYVKFLIVPFGYYFYFGFPKIPDPHLLYPPFIIGSALAVLILYWMKRAYRQNRDVFFALLFTTVAIAFFLNIIKPVAGVVAPRLAFQASAGYCLLLMLFLIWLSRHPLVEKAFTLAPWIKTPPAKWLTLVVLVMIFYAPFTISRNMDWKSKISLMDADHPNLWNSFQANRIASTIYLREVEEVDLSLAAPIHTEWVKKGLLTSRRAVSIDPDDQFTQEGIGIAHMLLGEKDQALRQFDFIIGKFEESLVAWDFTGDIYNERRDYPKAEICYKQAINTQPDIPYIYSKLRDVMLKQDKGNEAIDYFYRRSKITPEEPTPYQMIGHLYLVAGDTLTAARAFVDAYRHGSNDTDSYQAIRGYLEANGQQELLNEINTALFTR